MLSLRGFFPQEDLKLFRSIKGHYSGHPDMRHVKGVDMSTGSLGQGISAAVGMALAGKLAKKDYRVYALLGDGEIAEGQVWEAAMSAAKYHLDTLCAVVDVNGLLAKTTKGKGVSFMENNAGWHGKAPNDEQYAQAKAEVEAKLAELEGK